MARVIAYAILDPSVEWTGRQRLFVGGQLLGPVPRLALCQNIGGDLTDILLLHCNDDWESLGASGGPTLEDAKAEAERVYRGVSAKWIDTSTTPEQAASWIRAHYPDTICSFCGRLPTEFDLAVEGKGVQICSTCVQEFHKMLSERS